MEKATKHGEERVWTIFGNSKNTVPCYFENGKTPPTVGGVQNQP